MAQEAMIEIMAEGERLPQVRSEIHPSAIDPIIAPVSFIVEILAWR